MTKRYKLIAFDIDGTILDDDNRMCDHLRLVVDRLQEMGYLFTIVSARFPESALMIASELDIDEVVALNGAIVVNQKKEILYSRTFLTKQVEYILKELPHSVIVNYYSGFDWVLENPTPEKMEEMRMLYWDHMPSVVTVRPLEINKLTLMGNHKELEVARSWQKAGDGLLFAFSYISNLEITTDNISKLTGLQHLAELKGIKLDEIIAFGDGENDIPMLKGVGLGIAMDNAHDHVKAHAHEVAGYNYEQGVAKYLENLIARGIL